MHWIVGQQESDEDRAQEDPQKRKLVGGSDEPLHGDRAVKIRKIPRVGGILRDRQKPYGSLRRLLDAARLDAIRADLQALDAAIDDGADALQVR
jgi:hypothetical protein